MLMGRQLLFKTGLVWGNSLGIVLVHVSRTARLFELARSFAGLR